jgi:short-subunit dehydrogenase involved in D-alanine esterification of teichoic acids
MYKLNYSTYVSRKTSTVNVTLTSTAHVKCWLIDAFSINENSKVFEVTSGLASSHAFFRLVNSLNSVATAWEEESHFNKASSGLS